MTANDSKSHISYWNKLVDNTIILIIILLIKKPINAGYSVLTEKLRTNSKTRPFQVNDRVRITNYKNIFTLTYFLLDI